MAVLGEEAYDTSLSDYAKDQAETRPQLEPVRTLRGHLAKVYAMEWQADSRHLDGKLIVWDAYTGTKTHAIPLQSSWVMTCGFAPGGRYVASGGLDNTVSLFALRNEPLVNSAERTLTGHDGFLSCCRFVTDRELITSSGDMTCGKWDVETGRRTRIFRGHKGDVMSVSLSPTGPNEFVSGACDNTAMLWDDRREGHVRRYVGHTADINSVCFMANGLAFASGGDDTTCSVFDVRSCRPLQTFKENDGRAGVTSVSFSRSGRLLFAGRDTSGNGAFDIYDVLRGVRVSRLQHHASAVSCVGVTRRGDALCTGSWDSTLVVWTVRGWK